MRAKVSGRMCIAERTRLREMGQDGPGSFNVPNQQETCESIKGICVLECARSEPVSLKIQNLLHRAR